MSCAGFNADHIMADVRGIISNVEHGRFNGNKELVIAGLWAAVYTIAGVRNFAEEVKIYDKLSKVRNDANVRRRKKFNVKSQ